MGELNYPFLKVWVLRVIKMYQQGSNKRFHMAQSYVANLAKMEKYRAKKLKSQFRSFWAKYSFTSPTSIKQKFVHDIQGKERKYIWYPDNPMRPFPISIQDLPMFGLQPADNTLKLIELWTSIGWVNTLLMLTMLSNLHLGFDVLKPC